MAIKIATPIIEIKNFGPIKAFEFNVDDDFTLIVGENNIGKSYAISAVYLVLKTLVTAHSRLTLSYQQYERISETLALPTWVEKFRETHFKEDNLDVDITDAVAGHMKELAQTFLVLPLRESLLGTFNDLTNLQNKLSSDPFALTIRTGSLSVTLGIEQNELVVRNVDFQGHRFAVRHVKQNRTYLEYERSTVIYYPEENPDQLLGNYVSLFYRLYDRLTDPFLRRVSRLHYLPASRSGLYQALSAFGQIVAELAKSRSLLSRKIELPGISEPLSDYFLKLAEARPPTPSETDEAFQPIATSIEEQILLGTVDFDPKTKRLIYKPEKTDLRLDLSATSSMVSEISPIVAYLKLVLPRPAGLRRRRSQEENPPKQVVIIEEPEAHLHPDVQAKLLTVFAKLVQATNTKLIMTSHSNYIFNKTSNLVIAGDINAARFRAVVFKRGDTGSTATNLQVSDLGIYDENFLATGEAIYRERVELVKRKQ